MWQNNALYHTHEEKKEKKNYLQYIQMTVFNLYNLPCNVVCGDYSHLYEYLIKTPPAFSERIITIHKL